MDRNSNIYTVVYAAIMTVVVAVLLAFVFNGLKPTMDTNEKLATQKDILRSVGIVDAEDPAAIYNEKIESIVIGPDGNLIDSLTNKAEKISIGKEFKKRPEERLRPLYIYNAGEGKKEYIIPIYGNGLWDKIWGWVALQEDFNTIAGISMDHKAETPGLGAEIKDNPERYNEPYIGKTIMNDDGKFVSVDMVKGAVKEPQHQIDAISGATITSNGVNEMIESYLQLYMPYFESLNQQAKK